jgi:hypothetical protein
VAETLPPNGATLGRNVVGSADVTGATAASDDATDGEHQRTTNGTQNHIATNKTTANAAAFAGLALVSRRSLRINLLFTGPTCPEPKARSGVHGSRPL